jgi:hypothetical protein
LRIGANRRPRVVFPLPGNPEITTKGLRIREVVQTPLFWIDTIDLTYDTVADGERQATVIVAKDAGLQRVLKDCVTYYMHSRTHLALERDPPISRSVAPPTAGGVVATYRSAAYITLRSRQCRQTAVPSTACRVRWNPTAPH